ncbi:MAG TPA: CheR family methyltransferase [Candidatus Acidoferrum sp.]|jgi:chemotaxis methyl-accepting protein methylase|nr:CheR family methyltransferase [Candidatus Acidoferrum sp.]
MTTSPLDRATALIQSRAGLKAEPASRARLERLLQESASLAGIPLHSYVNMVDSQPAAFDELLDRVTVQHSSFFRDEAQFVAFEQLARAARDSPRTVWSAGCGNGQEPYSIAMLLDENDCNNWHVVATDVSFHALARTEKGEYSEHEIQGLSAARRQKYLRRKGAGFEIVPSLKSRVRIAHHNLARADAQLVVPEAGAVFCRNVLMYFGREESQASIQRIAERIAPGGHLFLGHSDSPGPMNSLFETVRVAGALCYRRFEKAAAPRAAVSQSQVAVRPVPNLPGLLAEGDQAAANGDLRAAVRAFRQATYLDPNVAVAYFQLGAALELAGDLREARRAFGAAGLAMMRGDGSEDLSGLGGYTRRDLARAIAAKLTDDRHVTPHAEAGH